MMAVAVLIGAPGTGKTKTAKRVARILGLEHLDTDRMIEAEHGPVREIFATQGEARFRELERAAIVHALRQPAIVSLGGGAVLDPETREDLRDRVVVQLTSTVEAMRERIDRSPKEIEKRPLLADGGIEAWARLVADRQPLYDEVTTVRFDTSHRPMDQVAQDVAAWIQGGLDQGQRDAIVAAAPFEIVDDAFGLGGLLS